jgi:hypothetical protein
MRSLVLILLFLVCLSPRSETFSQRKAVSESEVTGTFRSYFKGKARRSYNEILIQPLGNNKIRIEMELVYPYVAKGAMANFGTATGHAVINGDTAVFIPNDAITRDDSESCKITLRFTRPGTLVVTTENSLACGFGFNVSADGRYRKTSGAKPQFRS